jgi:Mg2+-importing ATPase
MPGLSATIKQFLHLHSFCQTPIAMAQSPTETFWRVPVDTLYRRVDSSPAGLNTAEAARRFARFGPNTAAPTPHRRLLRKIAKRLIEPLVAILLFAAAVSGLTGDAASFAIIVIVVVLSIVIDVVQEHRAEIATDALKRSVAIHSDVRRDGRYISVPAEQVVPGDIVELRAGDLVPADGVVLSSRNAHVNEALMTGEPFPTEKRAAPCDASTPADAFNALFAGTSLVNGEAIMLVVATGGMTRFGGIAAALTSSEPPSAFERGVHQLGSLILRLTIFLVLFVLLVHLSFGRPILNSFLFAVALAVGLTPELLPMIVTVTLSRGALRMATKSVVVKRLSAIHDLGAMDVLCTDKTGTLTEARISLAGHRGVQGTDDERVLTLALVNSAFSSGIRSPLDQAIVEHCKDDRLRQWTKIDEIPFDFERRCISVLAESGGKRFLIVKGVPERILPLSTQFDAGDGGAQTLDPARRDSLHSMERDEAMLGNRVLAIAWKSMPADCREIGIDDERDLVFAGYCIFVDPPKASAADAIARLAAAGVGVKIVSGDHEAVVRHVAQALKLPARKMLTGADLAELTDSALVARVEDVDLFARVTPDQKTRIIRALQARGHTVGFIGDGVNDAPAIRACDVGISVDGATDVARSAADMIMLEQDLGVIADGVEEGRRTFSNILKYVRMGTSSNFGNMLSMALASLVLPFLPLLPVQILLNNLLYDLSEIGIPFDRVDERELSQPHVWDMSAMLRFTWIMGAMSSVFDLATFWILSQWFNATPEVFRTAWFMESTATQILVIFIIRTRRPLLNKPSLVLVASSFGALFAAIAIVVTPLGGVFGFVDLPVAIIVAIAGVVIAYLLAAGFTKSLATRPASTGTWF